MTVELCEIGKPVTADDRAFIKILGYPPPPAAIDQLYVEFNGFSLIWRGSVQGREAQGSINILPFSVSASRPPKEETGAPLEGILWTEDSPDDVRDKLQKMTLFETLTGRSQFLTYVAGGRDSALFLVERDDIKPVVPGFDATLATLFNYAGINGLRQMLVHSDWQKRIAEDPLLVQIASWK